MFARITTADGSFNETCEVSAAGAMVAYGIVTYDGEASADEHCYTVPASGTGEVLRIIAAYAASEQANKHASPGMPGYPGPCPDGMGWSEWLAMNNVD